MDHNIYVAMVKPVQLSTKLKTAPRMTTRSRNHGTNDTSLTSRTEEDQKELVETIEKIVRKKNKQTYSP